MILTISNEVPFQILSSSFSIGPSQTGYELQVGADSRSFSTLFSVGANTPRMVTNVANGSYFRLKNNVGDVKVNWQRVCVDEGGGSGSGTELSPVSEFPLGAEAGTVIAYSGSSSAAGIYQFDGTDWVEAGGSVDLSAYWTSAETKDYVDSADTALQEQIDTMDEVVSEALVDLNERIGEISGSSVDLSAYWTSAETQSAITAVEDHLFDVEEVTASALTELHDAVLELSGSSVDLSGYYTSGETDAAISAATAGKADAVNMTANTNKFYFPTWNSQGVINGITGGEFYLRSITINGTDKTFPCYDHSGNLPTIYAPTTSGNPGEVLVADGTNTPKWSAMPAADVTKAYVDSAITQVQDRIDTMDEVISDALNDLNGELASKVSSSSVAIIWKGTQAEFDAATQSGTTADPATLYIIV